MFSIYSFPLTESISNEYFDINPISWLKFLKIRQIFHPRRNSRFIFHIRQLIIYIKSNISPQTKNLSTNENPKFNQSNIPSLPPKIRRNEVSSFAEHRSTFKSNDVQTKLPPSRVEGGGRGLVRRQCPQPWSVQKGLQGKKLLGTRRPSGRCLTRIGRLAIQMTGGWQLESGLRRVR